MDTSNVCSYNTVSSQFPGQYTPAPDSCFIDQYILHPLEQRQIICFVDVSGSTNNTHGSRRGQSRGTDSHTSIESEEKTKDILPKTKIIILAELEGISHMFCSLMLSFNLDGVKVIIRSFGNAVYDCVDFTITSHQEFYDDIIRNLDTFIKYDGGSTALKPALETIGETSLSTLLVIATDGQPNLGGNSSDVLAYMKPILTDPDSSITSVITIGAGSIQNCTEGLRRTSSDRFVVMTRDDGVFDEVVAFFHERPSVAGNTECNNLFLIELSGASKCGMYCPACTDYSELLTAMNDYLTKYIQKIQNDEEQHEDYYTVLDDGSHSRLPSSVKLAFENGDKAIIIKNAHYGYYLVTRDRQFAVEPVNQTVLSPNITEFRNLISLSPEQDILEILTDSDYKMLYGMSFDRTDFYENFIVSSTVGAEIYKFRLCSVNARAIGRVLPRMRQVICK